MAGLWFQFDFQENDFVRALVEHVMFDSGFPEVGFSQAKLRLGTFAVGRNDGHFAGSDRNDHVIHLMDVMSGGATRRQPPLGNADLRSIDLNLRFGTHHLRWSPDLGMRTLERIQTQRNLRTGATGSTVSSRNSGSKTAAAHIRYPKKLGIRMPRSFAMATIIRFGAFPI